MNYNEVEDYKNAFQNKGYVIVKNIISKEVANFLYDYMKVKHSLRKANDSDCGDGQVPDAVDVFGKDIAFDSIYLNLLPKMECVTGIDLLPTYTFGRLYRTNNTLLPHTDRESCEISASIKLGDNEDYSWPIWFENESLELEDGDAVIYRGIEKLHWRDKCTASNNYLLGQLFVHAIDVNGPYYSFKYDEDPLREKTLSSFYQ